MKRHFDFATLAGMATWALVYGLSLHILQRLNWPHSLWPVHGLFLLYGALFYLLTNEQSRYSLTTAWGRPLLLLQLGAAFGLLWLLPQRYFDFLAILTIIWAGILPFVMRTYYAVIVIVLVIAAWFSLVALRTDGTVWISALLYGSFHLFALLVQSANRDAQLAKQELEQKHQQLQATQQLLQAASRQSERTRIARNLHDLVGHHLTALTIQLQVAGHLAQGEVKPQIEKCHQLAKLLLNDVREAVSTMREFADMTLSEALQPMLALLPQQLTVKLDIAPQIMLHDLQQAQHLLYVIQEALSNSLKHSGATELRLAAFMSDGRLVIQIHDNGQLPANWQAGNGIKGMQERLAECAGKVEFTRQDQAMALTVSVPYQEREHD
jgi:two-component system, NarL family, sensor histidine kinase DesK